MGKKVATPNVLHYDKDGKLMSAIGAGVGHHFVEEYFPKASEIIRIGSGFFRISGHKIGKEHINKNVKLCILVGKSKNNGEAKDVQKLTVKEIVAELGKYEVDLAEAVIDLLEKIKHGKFVIKEAREMRSAFHCKIYISDEELFWHGSANYSQHALTKQAEQISLIEDFEQVKKFVGWYDAVAANARDLLEELKKRLQEWLDMVEPFDIYLKTLFHLFNHLSSKPYLHGAHQPTYFQKGVISQALNQIENYGGALIIAATGLGKTVIGAELALRLKTDKKINKVIIIAPQVVHDNWEKECNGREFETGQIFNITIPFQPESLHSRHLINVLKEKLNAANEQTLVIIDEAHFYRNQLLNEKRKKAPSRVYELFQSAVKRGAKIVLLTATAYSTDFQNNNSLLYFLPPRKKILLDDKSAWKIDSPEEFIELPVVTILGIPHVLKMARDRGNVENDRVFIRLPNDKIYFPKQLILHRVNYRLFLQNELLPAFDAGNFDQAKKVPNLYFSDDVWSYLQGVSDTIAKSSLKGWLSSPPVMKDNLESNLLTLGKNDLDFNTDSANPLRNGESYQPGLFQSLSANNNNNSRQTSISVKGQPFKARMRLDQIARNDSLQSVYESLCRLTPKDDDKFNELKKIVENECINKKGKVIIFVNRLLTAGYLAEELDVIYGKQLNIGCTVDYKKKPPKLKEGKIRSEVLDNFSPCSRKLTTKDEHNVLICTDADGVGVNLQDANTLINYDPPSGADALFQRVGRILRMTNDPNRIIEIHTFIPTLVEEPESNSQTQKDVKEIFERLRKRNDHTESILGLKVLSQEKDVVINFDTDLKITNFLHDGELIKDIGGLGAESRLRHISTFEENQEQAEKVPDFIFSARGYNDSTPRMFVLIKNKDKYIPILFNIFKQQVETEITDLNILDIIECNESESRATVRIEEIEHQANQAVRAWRKITRKSRTRITKVCGLYLVPYNQASNAENIFPKYDRD